MRNIFCLLAALAFFSCQKEEELKNEIDFTNIYAIAPDPDDPVQQERYRLYETYNVSVYLNDTINQYYVRDDIYGNPVYRYERIDPKWTFFNDPDNQISGTFKYFFTEGQERQLKLLGNMAYMLERVAPAVRPRLVLSVDSVYRINGSDTLRIGTLFNYRSLLCTKIADMSDEELELLASNVEILYLDTKIDNYPNEIQKFGLVSDGKYGTIGLSERLPKDDIAVGKTLVSPNMTYYGRQEAMTMSDEEYLESLNRLYKPSVWGAYITEADWLDFIEKSRMAFTEVTGPYGFVSYRSNGYVTPESVTADKGAFLELMLMYTPEEFEHYWGKYSDVMKKYQILYDLITNELGVEL